MDYDIKPEATTSLSQMLEFGLQKHLDRFVTANIQEFAFLHFTVKV